MTEEEYRKYKEERRKFGVGNYPEVKAPTTPEVPDYTVSSSNT